MAVRAERRAGSRDGRQVYDCRDFSGDLPVYLHNRTQAVGVASGAAGFDTGCVFANTSGSRAIGDNRFAFRLNHVIDNIFVLTAA